MFVAGTLESSGGVIVASTIYNLTTQPGWDAVERWRLVEVGWVPDPVTPPSNTPILQFAAGGLVSPVYVLPLANPAGQRVDWLLPQGWDGELEIKGGGDILLRGAPFTAPWSSGTDAAIWLQFRPWKLRGQVQLDRGSC